MLPVFEHSEFKKSWPSFWTTSCWTELTFPVAKGRSTSQILDVRLVEWSVAFVPRTDLGKRLVALRNKAIAAGMQLLSEEEVLEEVKRRREEHEENETDLY
jgi:hypothetical protein